MKTPSEYFTRAKAYKYKHQSARGQTWLLESPTTILEWWLVPLPFSDTWSCPFNGRFTIHPIYSIHLHPKSSGIFWCRGFRWCEQSIPTKKQRTPQLPSKHLALPGSNNFSSRLLLDSHLSEVPILFIPMNLWWNLLKLLILKLTYKRPSINTAVPVSITNLKRKCDIPRFFVEQWELHSYKICKPNKHVICMWVEIRRCWFKKQHVSRLIFGFRHTPSLKGIDVEHNIKHEGTHECIIWLIQDARNVFCVTLFGLCITPSKCSMHNQQLMFHQWRCAM